MKKFKFGLSFLLLIVFSLITKSFLIFLNYILALILHELGHLIVAVNKGYKLKMLKIDMFGVSLDLESKLLDKDQFAINIAGPLTNILICLVCVAIFWLVPSSYLYLNTFCLSNLVLALFNLLPIYPLDGGKIFANIITSPKVLKWLDRILRWSLFFIFLLLFILSSKVKLNFVWLLFSVFFLTSRNVKSPSLSLFKSNEDNQKIQKINLIKVDENCTLYDLIKRIKKNKYTVFYCSSYVNKCIDEENLIKIALKNKLSTKLKECKEV